MSATVRKQSRRAGSRLQDSLSLPHPLSSGGLALRLASLSRERGSSGLIYLMASDSEAERLAKTLWQIASEVDTILFPAWDCIPYDRLSPSPRIQGLRVSALVRLEAPSGGPWIVLATADAAVQKVPPAGVLSRASYAVELGQSLDTAVMRPKLVSIGYAEDDRVDEPGEFAIRGQVLDLFPAGYALPVRIEHRDGRVVGIASYDPRTQRTTGTFDTLLVRPVSEVVLAADDTLRSRGVEHRLPEIYEDLATLFDYAPEATLVVDGRSLDRRMAFLEQIGDAFDSRCRLKGGGSRPSRASRLYLDPPDSDGLLEAMPTIRFTEPETGATAGAVPNFALAAKPGAALEAFLATQMKAGRRVVLAAPEPDLAGLERRVARVFEQAPRRVARWQEIATMPAGIVASISVRLPAGFVCAEENVAVVTAADLLGSSAEEDGGSSVDLAGFGDDDFRMADAVIHLDHGVGILEGLESVSTGNGDALDTIRLRYAGDSILMVPIDDVDRMWRYGSAGGVTLDRLDGQSWPQRRAKVEREIGTAASELARVADERRRTKAARMLPPRAEYERFVARFPYAETPDQRRAIKDILGDLSSGHTMNRLVCGDVGFGKTEVALRAAAAAALAGKQVAVVAPTTVLVRQHLDTFTRRFADLGIAIGHLSRLVSAADAKTVKAGLADGRIRVVIGTHALAGKEVAFRDLGLLVVDEEQRFGAGDKARLRALGDAVHVLTLSATPIPRTMQAALVGLQDVSVLATPPAERQPVHTVVSEFDDVVVRDALVREHRRSGQSFVVCPQIDDLDAMADRLRVLAPELVTFVAHGKLPPAEIDDIMVRFGNGEGDVLLATNIIESGLDVPRANTIVVWRADRFGLAQLHQLRGRVGRGRARGVAYLTIDPDTSVPGPTMKRLHTLERFDRLGAGFAISAEDLDQRGAGDLMGDTQAGHVRLIGAGLYRRLLERALRAARGEGKDDGWSPEVKIGASGHLPVGYVPEPDVRLNLYARIAHCADARAETQIADEIEDRFGPRPEAVDTLLATARLRRICRDAGIAKVDAGPHAIAVSFKETSQAERALVGLVERAHGALVWKKGRLIFGRRTADHAERTALAQALLQKIRSTLRSAAPAPTPSRVAARSKAGDKTEAVA